MPESKKILINMRRDILLRQFSKIEKILKILVLHVNFRNKICISKGAVVFYFISCPQSGARTTYDCTRPVLRRNQGVSVGLVDGTTSIH